MLTIIISILVHNVRLSGQYGSGHVSRVGRL